MATCSSNKRSNVQTTLPNSLNYDDDGDENENEDDQTTLIPPPDNVIKLSKSKLLGQSSNKCHINLSQKYCYSSNSSEPTSHHHRLVSPNGNCCNNNVLHSETASTTPVVDDSGRLRPRSIYLCLFTILVILLLLLTVISHYHFIFNRNLILYSFNVSAISPSSSFGSLCGKFFHSSSSSLYDNCSVTSRKLSTNQVLHLILRDSHEAPEVILSSNSIKDVNGHRGLEPPIIDVAKCSHYSCFDIYKCGTARYNPYELPKQLLKQDDEERIKIYVYPSFKYVTKLGAFSDIESALNLPTKSAEFSRILYAIVTSPYFTSDPSEACLFIPNIDLLNSNSINTNDVEQFLWSLPQFSKMNGSNHLLFSMIDFIESNNNNSFLFGINIGNSIVASGGFDISNFRTNFDISIPVYSTFSQLYGNPDSGLQPVNRDAISSLPRKWVLISTQIDLLIFETRYYLTRLESIYSNKMLLLSSNCQHYNSSSADQPMQLFKYNDIDQDIAILYNQTYVCNIERKLKHRYLDILHHSEFCLILKTSLHWNSPLLSDALMSGCIPIILIDQYQLPFSDRIDWPSVAVRIWEHSTNELFDIINSISAERRRQLRANGLLIWNQYFRTIENITLITLNIINERIFPKPKNVFSSTDRKFYELTPLSFDFYSKGNIYISPKNVYLRSYGFTTLILTYNRIESLHEVIHSLSHVPSCTKIIVIWNNQNIKPPDPAQWPSVSIPIQVIISEENKLSNRFYPYKSIQTEAVFAIDDDITMLNADEIEFAYQTWREFPDRIVGFPSRLHYWNNFTHFWNYDSEWKNQISLVLTGAAFYHSYFNYLYTFILPSSIREWVDSNMNCEDIAMNFLVSNITGKAPIKVTPRKKFKCPECSHTNTLSADVLRHLRLRSNCVDYFAHIFKMMPLKSVEFRANPVLFRDNIPEKFKQYNLIGNL